MSAYPPPENQPHYDVLPPPPHARGGDGCWKWGGLGCGLGCLSLAIVIAAGLFIIAPQVKPLFSECLKVESDAGLVQQQMRDTLRAVERYKDAKGKFPPNLEALVPAYLQDRGAIRYSQNPRGPSFKYTVPTESGGSDGPILEYALTFKLLDGRTVPIPVRLSRDGTFDRIPVPEQCSRIIRPLE